MFRSALCAFGRIESKSHTNLCHGMSYQVQSKACPLLWKAPLNPTDSVCISQVTTPPFPRWSYHLSSQSVVYPLIHPSIQQTADSPFLGEFFDASYSYSKATANKPPSAPMTWLLALGSETPKLGILMPLFPPALTIHLFNLTTPHSPVQGRRKALLSKWTENTRVQKPLEEKVFVFSQEDSGKQITTKFSRPQRSLWANLRY